MEVVLTDTIPVFVLLLFVDSYFLGSFATATCRNCGLKVDSEAIREDIDSGVPFNRTSFISLFFLKSFVAFSLLIKF